MGDAVDNIKGVPGIGPKTASMLMKHFTSLDEIYADLDRVSQLKMRGAAAVGARLREHREAAYLARQLTCIACDMPLELGEESLRRRLPDMSALSAFYDAQGFGPMLRKQGERLSQLPL
jgi:5'-3' exonuclease